MSIYDNIYRQLVSIGVVTLIESGEAAAKSKAAGFMDLHFDLLYRAGKTVTVSLAHYYKQNGDSCADPDMEIRIHTDTRMAEALTFQQANPPLYTEVYPAHGRARIALNQFLLQWLANCVAQGHCFGAGGSGAEQ